jgi:hypothetical protein
MYCTITHARTRACQGDRFTGPAAERRAAVDGQTVRHGGEGVVELSGGGGGSRVREQGCQEQKRHASLIVEGGRE